MTRSSRRAKPVRKRFTTFKHEDSFTRRLTTWAYDLPDAALDFARQLRLRPLPKNGMEAINRLQNMGFQGF